MKCILPVSYTHLDVYKRQVFANPAYVQIHPTCIPVHGDKQSKLTLMSESLRNDGRILSLIHIYLARQIQTATSLTAGDVKSVLESLSHFMGERLR